MAAVIDEHTQFVDSSGAPIVNGYIYIGTRNLDPKLNTITIYSDRDLTTTISNPQRTDADGRAENKIWVPERYSIKVEDSNNVQKYQELDLGELPASGITTLSNVSGTNAIVAEASPVITSYTDKEVYRFTALNENTSSVTLNGGGGAKAVTKNHDLPLTGGEIESGQVVTVIYESASDSFELQSNTREAARIDLGADVTSAASLLVNIQGNAFDVTGTTAITSIASKGVGSRITLQFDAALTLTHHATNLILPGGVNIQTAAGDIAEFYEYSSGDWRLINYQSAWGNTWYTQYIDFTNGDADDTGTWTFDLPGISGDGYRLLLHGLAADTAGWFPSLRFRRVGDGSVTSSASSYNAAYGAVSGAGTNNNSATRIDLLHTTLATNDVYRIIDIQIYAPHGPGNAGSNTPSPAVIWNGMMADTGTGISRTYGAGELSVSNSGIDQVQVYLGNGAGNFNGGHGMLTRHRDIFG